MKSKLSHEGYLLIDHSAGPGLDGKQGHKLEVGIHTCSHCQKGVMVNPLRTRDRAYCPKCDHYICDECEVARVASGGLCRTFNQLADELLTKAYLAQQRIMF